MKLSKINTLFVAGVMAASTTIAQAEPQELWSTGGFMNPESVYDDAVRNVLYVSNVNGSPLDRDRNGFISKVSKDGEILDLSWVAGLNAPKGMIIHNDRLFVTDIDKLIEIDIDKAEIAATYQARGAIFLNDPAVDGAGNIYVSDIAARKIWRMSNDKMAIWYDGDDIMHPNGLRVEGDKLLVAGWGREMNNDGSTNVPGNIFTIDLNSKTLSNLGGGQGIGNLDGLERDASGNFLVTDWVNGALYRIREDGTHDTLLDLNQGSADLEVIDGGKIAVIPMMMDSKVTAYSVD